MEVDHRVFTLIQQLYAAPGTTTGWQAFLESLRATMHGSGAHLVSHNLQSQTGTMIATVGQDVEGTRMYQQHWSSYDPWAHSAKQASLVEGSVSVGDALIEHAALKRTAFYADFARHYDLVRVIGGVLEKGSACSSVVSVSRSEQRPPFGGQEIALFEVLVPHLQRALQLHRRLALADAAVEEFANVIDCSSRAVFLINCEGRITFANRAASRLVARRDGLTVQRGELRAARAADTTRLRALVADAIKTSKREGVGAGGVLAIGRSPDRLPLNVLVSPSSQERELFQNSERTSAIVFVSDPEQVDTPDEGTLQELFGLTPAEAKLARLVAQGVSLTDAATRLGLRRETIRSRVKSIFGKTKTHRQSELVSVLLKMTPNI